MASLNKIEIIGNLGTDPQMKIGRGGSPYTTFNVATNYVQHATEGERKQQTQWFTVSTWDKLAELCNQHLHKSSTVFVEGRAYLRQWEDSSGNHKAAIEIKANRVIFLDKAPKDFNTDEFEDDE